MAVTEGWEIFTTEGIFEVPAERGLPAGPQPDQLILDPADRTFGPRRIPGPPVEVAVAFSILLPRLVFSTALKSMW